ncbi:PREDICTED: UPF0488 protein CG14286, partial [Ceratosolen solmsi marchali]|uniref:UPF0488 protein CG14286 n=1 Tax=Ceratosolen solmsi marchali TaxID=326594 RepID=A0AAJ7DZL1_9HYME
MSNSYLSTSLHKTASGLNQEAEDQFELELCWCIQQLQTGLTDMKLQDRQIYNLTKSLNVLKSNNASLIKKRQVMRNTFGDYRSNMEKDEKKYGKTSSVVKFITCDTKQLGKKSSFLRKAHFLTNTTNKNEKSQNDDKLPIIKSIKTKNTYNEPFKFNFS